MASKGRELLSRAAILMHMSISARYLIFALLPAEQGGEGPKGSGKKKGKTLPLTDFLKPASMGNWADDDVEDSRECPYHAPACAS